ncbi:MAG: hypothetical protein JWQ85_3213 [Mucilaginibacter sp.]|nr:hypothetical protein [Mucilaginibacter sp.]
MLLIGMILIGVLGFTAFMLTLVINSILGTIIR